MRTLSAPSYTPSNNNNFKLRRHNDGTGNRNSLATFTATTEQYHQHYHNLTNSQILAQRQLESDMETMLANNVATTHWTHREPPSQRHHLMGQQLSNCDKGGNSGFNSSGGLAAILAIPKWEPINHATMTTPTSAIAPQS